MASEANNVTLSTNFNVAPYYDDFNEDKNFHRILFRPGLAVQARELTQMQTILQNQIDRFASHIFQEGSTVHGLETNYDTRYSYIKLRNRNSTGANTVTVSDFSNKIVKGTTSGVLATVVNVSDGSESSSPNYKTLFIKYLAANNSTGYRFFANNEIISTVGGGTIFTANTITSTQGGSTGFGAAVKFNAGIVYAKDHFIRIPEQTVVVSKYNSRTASARVGFDITETIVTETTDESLLDPASGSYNYAAPGAARLKLTANVRSVALTSAVSNTFVELFQVKNGVVQSISTRPQYAQIRDYIAQRTSDESGDYVVNGFELNVREHLKAGNNQGLLTAAQGGNNNFLVVFAEPGKAYVKGYDIERIASVNRVITKAIDVEAVESAKTLADYGNYVIVDNTVGNWDVNNQNEVSLRSSQHNAVSSLNYSATAFSGSQIGTARVRGIQHYSGTPGLPTAQYKLYLTDIKMAPFQSFSAVQSIGSNTNSTIGVKGKADILNSNGTNSKVSEASFDRAIFRLPAQAIKRLRDTSGNVDNDYSIFKSYDVTFAANGYYSLPSGEPDETFDGTGTLSPSATRTDFYVVARSTANTANLTGTVTITSGSNTVTGVGTLFTTQVNPGDIIGCDSGAGFLVREVANSTSLKLFTNAGSSKAGFFHKQFKAGQVIDFGGVGRLGSRGIKISSATTAELSMRESFSTSFDGTVVARLNKIDGQEKSKSILRNRLVQIRVGAGGGNSYVATTTGPWSLGVSDGFRLVEVRKKNGSNFSSATEGTVVTSQFTLNSGMLDNYYSHARLVRKSSTPALVAGDRLLVKLDYFTHGTAKSGFFSVDSYPVNDATAASDTSKIFTYQIPVYISPTSGASYDLRDSVDFRPRMKDTANSITTISGLNLSTNPLTSNTFVSANGGLRFSPTGEDFTTDLEYYLRRVDIIGLSADGSLVVTKGAPSVRPATPSVPNDIMAMGSIELAPYPSLPPVLARRVGRSDLANKFRKFDNRRYTMRDIGKIAERIDRLEYYTSLTLLEQTAQDMLVQDSGGNNRFKNGILVDSFTTHAVGNVFDPDYKVAIDPTKGEMRPRFTNDETPLVMTSDSTNVVRTNVTPTGVSRDQYIVLDETPGSSSFLPGTNVTSGAITATISERVGNRLYVEDATGNFVATTSIVGNRALGGTETRTISSVTKTKPGKLVTLPYSHKILVNQPYATTTRNCAGAVWSFVGDLALIPDSDYWCDTIQGPDTNITLDLNTDAWQYLASSWSATWNAPITSFNGQAVFTGTKETEVGKTYTKDNPDGSKTIYQDIRTESFYSTPTITITTGKQPGVKTVTNKQSLGNLVKDTSISPYMRSRHILFKMQGMKAATRLYAFFDEINVSQYITQLTEAEFNSGLKDVNGAPVKAAATEGAAFVVGNDETAYGLFRLPNDSALKFKTGSKRLRFVDNPTNSSTFGQYTTACEETYTAEGLIKTVSATTVTTKSVTISSKDIDRTTYGTDTSSTSASSTKIVGTIPAPEPDNDDGGGNDPPVYSHNDPIAQTFFVSSLVTAKIKSTGMYLTKVDLFFATKDATRPVTLQLQEVEPLTGAITSKVVPFSKVTLNSAAVNTSSNGSAATPFYFPSPVYLTNETEYAIVVIPGSGNPNYSLFTAVLGETDLLSSPPVKVSEQPAAGLLFISSNQRTFTPIKNEDIKFTAYYAEFDKSSVGSLIVKNAFRDHLTITNPTTGKLGKIGEVVHGQTRLVGTFSPGNGLKGNTATGNSFVQGMTSGATGKIVSVSANHVIVRDVSIGTNFVNTEPVRFRLGGSATTSPLAGNSTGNITSATYPIGRVSYYDENNYDDPRLILANTRFYASGSAFANNKYFFANMYIKGQTNGYSATISAVNGLTVDNMNLVTNAINPSNNQLRAFAKMATSTSTRDAAYFRVNINDDTELKSPRFVLSRSIESNSAMTTTRSLEIKYELAGKNKVASPAVDLDRIALYHTHNLISTSGDVGTTENYVSFGGNSQTRYITRIVTLADGQDAEDLRVYLTAYRPSGSNVYVYYKILSSQDNDTMSDSRWIPMTLNEGEGFTSSTRYSSSENQDDFLELTYDVPNYTTVALSGANNSTGIIEYRNSVLARYSKFKYFQIKIVLVNSKSTNPPRVKDMRALALLI